MWQQIHDCGKQLNAGYRIRQTVREEDEYVTEYKITEIETDQYKLLLVSKLKNNVEVPIDPNEVVVLNCDQIIEYHLEVWVEDAG
ncbi:MAG: hypothetical protein ABIN67_02830 [Ferruginibacter sp.]